MTPSQKTGRTQEALVGVDGRAGRFALAQRGLKAMQPDSSPTADQSDQNVTRQLRDGTAFSSADRAAVYQAIFTRRDVRGEFLPDPLPDELVARILNAGHRAPSVGLSQPWDFILVRDAVQREAMAQIFAKANAEAAELFAREGRDNYRALKLEGIQSAPLNICVTADPARNPQTVIGTTHMPDMQLFSTVCAIENMWLAARAEGVGMGWVSILDEDAVKGLLGIPPSARVVGYLTMGYVRGFFTKAELEARGWKKRDALADHVFEDGWGRPAKDMQPLLASEDVLADRIARGG